MTTIQNTPSEWTDQDNMKFERLFKEYGTSWSSIRRHFINKNENSLKNKVNNSFRKLASLLNNCEYQLCRRSNRNITVPMLLSMVDVCCQAERLVSSKGCTVNPQSKISICNRELIRLCFKKHPSQEEIKQLLKNIRSLNFSMKSFGIFKQKHRKGWKLSTRVFKSILTFDKFVMQDNFMLDDQNQPKPQKKQAKNVQSCQKQIKQTVHEQKIKLKQESIKIQQQLNKMQVNVYLEPLLKINGEQKQRWRQGWGYGQRYGQKEEKQIESTYKVEDKSNEEQQLFKIFWNNKFSCFSSSLANYFIMPPLPFPA